MWVFLFASRVKGFAHSHLRVVAEWDIIEPSRLWVESHILKLYLVRKVYAQAHPSFSQGSADSTVACKRKTELVKQNSRWGGKTEKK